MSGPRGVTGRMNPAKKLIVGVSGVAGSGKTTVAKILDPYGLVTVSLADPIKRIARDVWSFTDQQLWGSNDLRNAPDPRYPRADGSFLTPRDGCQRIGTEGRECYEYTWVDPCLRTAQQLMQESDLRYRAQQGLLISPGAAPCCGVVIPDCRFLHEVQAIQAIGGIVIRIVRPEAGLPGDAGLHVSETAQACIPDSHFDHVVHNIGTISELRGLILAIVGLDQSLSVGSEESLGASSV